MKRQHELLSCKYALKRMATGHPRILDPHSRKRNQGTKIYFYILGICLNLTNKSCYFQILVVFLRKRQINSMRNHTNNKKVLQSIAKGDIIIEGLLFFTRILKKTLFKHFSISHFSSNSWDFMKLVISHISHLSDGHGRKVTQLSNEIS